MSNLAKVCLFCVMSAASAFGMDSNPFVMGALGDSITTAMNSRGWGNDGPSSWATGDRNVMSHYERLKTVLTGSVQAFNVAKSGSKAEDLQRQVRKLLPHNPNYTTLLIGGNDVCSWDDDYEQDLQKFDTDVDQAIAALIHHNPEMKILMVPIPNMGQLRELGVANGCQRRWNFFGICSGLLHSRRTPEERARFIHRLNEANRTLANIADNYRANVQMDDSLGKQEFEWKHVSKTDCFHPSRNGQKLIAELSWDEDWVL